MKKIHRFITKYEIKNGEIEISDSSLIHQFKNVLKFKIGENIIIANKGKEALGEIMEISKDKIILKVESEMINKNEPKRKVNLFLAILKKENFEEAIEKATEVGIGSITPIITERTVKTGLNMERLEKIVKEASELSGRSEIPKINEIKNFEEVLNNLDSTNTILFDIEGEKLEGINKNEINIMIGPEGGWAEREINRAKEKGISIASISPLTLRGETATIIASYLSVSM